MKLLLRSALALALALAALAASAQTITFENLAGTGTSDGAVRYYGATVTSGGFAFTATGAYGLASFDNSGGGSYNYTGSVALFNDTTDTTVGMVKTGGGTFGLASLQLASLFPSSGVSRSFTFLGTRADGTTVSQTTSVSLANALTTVGLTGFTNLTSFTLPTQNGGQFYQFDNVVVNANPTPEPSALAALGLGAVAFARRRRRA